MSRTVAVLPSASAIFGFREKESVAALAPAHLFLKHVAGAQQRAEFLLRVLRELSNQIFDVDPPPVDRLVAEERSMLLVNIRSDC